MSKVQHLLELVGSELDEYSDPIEARGSCWTASNHVLTALNFDDAEFIYTQHFNDPQGRYIRLQQHSDHYAVFLTDTEQVIDYTLRQFDPGVPFPYIGTVEDWSRILSGVWEVEFVRTFTGLECGDCGLMEVLCTCCNYCGGIDTCNCG